MEAFDNDDYTQDYYFDDADDNGGAFGEDAEGTKSRRSMGDALILLRFRRRFLVAITSFRLLNIYEIDRAIKG